MQLSIAWNNIDIVIYGGFSMQAVIMENKIWVADQRRQLQRYAKEMKEYERHVL